MDERNIHEMTDGELAAKNAVTAAYAKLLAEIYKMKAEYPPDEVDEEIVKRIIAKLEKSINE